MADNELMLTTGLVDCNWVPMERQTIMNAVGGQTPVMVGTPYWQINFSYQNFATIDEFRELTAWIARRRGAFSPFKAFRAMLRNPRGGATSCTASGQANGTVNVSASPAAQVGDMVAFNSAGGGRCVVQLTAANGGNNFDCFPPAKTGSGSPEIVDAGGYFRLMPETLQVGEPYDIKRRVSFSARQVEPS